MRPRPAAAWFPGTPAGPYDVLPLISFPYAGGTPSAFHDWPQHLGERVRVVPVLLPGRGLRLREEPYTVLEPLARDVARALLDHGLTTGGYAFFGHSMGALLAYEVACELRRRGEPEPLHLFVSGSRAPHLYGDRADHALDDDELRAVVRDLGGLGPDENVGRAYLDRRLPALRADLRACELYRWQPRTPLTTPVTAVSATDDPVATEVQVDAWKITTAGPFARLHLPGNHFFLNGPSRYRLLRELRRTCDHLRPQTSQRNAS
ncbi:thioesterase [Streptomyces sp. JJ36]|nr:thioesterase [Streptomyces sp. JJ36]